MPSAGSLNPVTRCPCVFANRNIQPPLRQEAHDAIPSQPGAPHQAYELVRSERAWTRERGSRLMRQPGNSAAPNRRSARTADRSCSAVSRAVARARRVARAASAIVSAEVTLRPLVLTDFSASASRSSSAATGALDAMYRIPVVSAPEAGALVLRLATIGVDQFGGSSRKANIRPSFCWVTGFDRWTDHLGRN